MRAREGGGVARRFYRLMLETHHSTIREGKRGWKYDMPRQQAACDHLLVWAMR